MKKFKVEFQGGQSRYSDFACNYMLAKIGDVELYAERTSDQFREFDECAETWDEFIESWDEYSYSVLREEIVEQAKEEGINPESLQFFWD